MRSRRLVILMILLAGAWGCGRGERPQVVPAGEPVSHPLETAEQPPGPPAGCRHIYDLVAASAAAGPWQALGAPRVFAGRELTDMIDGAAERYFRYGFKAAARLDYSNPEVDNPITVDVYDMGTAADAFGIHSLAGMTGSQVDIGNDGVYSPPTLLFWKGKYLVHVYAVSRSAEAEEAVMTLGRALAGRIDDVGARPEIVSLFPEDESRVRIAYLHEAETLANSDFAYVIPYDVTEPNPFNLSEHTEMALAEYEVGEEFPAAAFVAFYASPEDAAVAYNNVSVFCDAGLTGRYVFGVERRTSPEIAELFQRLKENVGGAQ